MKFRHNVTTITIYFLFTLIWFPLQTSTSELIERNIIPVLEHATVSKHCDEYHTNTLGLLHEIKEKIVSLQQKYDENTNIISALESTNISQELLPQNFTNRLTRLNEIKQQIIFLQQKLPKPPNTLTLCNAINNNNISVIFFPFLTMQDILILRGTCKNFQILLQPNKQNDMVIFCKNFRSKDIYEAPLKWFDLKYLLNQSYITAFSKIEIFNIKTNEYALLIHYTVPICHKNIISLHNDDMNYPQILFDRATNKEIFENEQVSDHKLLLPHYDCPIIIYNKCGEQIWAKITKEKNVVHGGEIFYGGDQPQLKNVKMIVSSAFSFAALLDDGHVVWWGNEMFGGKISNEIQLKLQNVTMIFSNVFSFAALLKNGHVVAWGNENAGGIIPDETQLKLQNVKLIFSSNGAFAALLNDGHVVAWGNEICGGKIPDEIQLKLQNVKMIFSNNGAFAALLECGSVFAWGRIYDDSRIPDEIQRKLINNVKTIIPGYKSFTAICNDGEIIIFGFTD